MPASQLGIQGLDATVTTKISYMDDAPVTSYRTRADYKKVVVTVVRNTDSRALAQDVTYVAPPGAGAYAGQSQGIVLAQIIDYALNTPLVNATVTVSGGPSPTRNDLTDAAGSAVFPALLPTNVTLNHYDVTPAFTGYVTLRDDLPPATASRTALVAGQTFNTVIRMYKPATIYVVAKNPDGSLVHRDGQRNDRLVARDADVLVHRRPAHRADPCGRSRRAERAVHRARPRLERDVFDGDDGARAERIPDRPDEDVHADARRNCSRMPTLTVKVVNAVRRRAAQRGGHRQRRPRLEHPAHRHDECERSRRIQRAEQLGARLHDVGDPRRAHRHRERRRHRDNDENGDHPMIRDEHGFTLPELLVGMTLLAIVLAAFGQMLITSSKTSNRVEEQAALQSEVRASVDRLTTDFRQATTTGAASPVESVELDVLHLRLA